MRKDMVRARNRKSESVWLEKLCLRATIYINALTLYGLKMKHIVINIAKSMTILLAIAFAAGVQSCQNMIYDDEGNCESVYKVRFKYEMNMKYADAFPSECKSVALYVFDEEGKYLKTYASSVSAMKADDYALILDLDPGKYKFVAWCGLEENSKSISMTSMTEGMSSYEDLTAKINRESGIASQLDNFYYGSLDATLPDTEGVHEYVIGLVKDMNTVNLVLQVFDENPIAAESYDFYITYDDGFMNWDNTLHEDEVLTFKPQRVSKGTAEALIGDEGKTITAYTAKINVGRLVKDWKGKARIHIDSSDGENLVNVPLIDYIMLIKDHYQIDDQEYLDRQDTFDFVFFIMGGKYISSEIFINSWKVVLQDENLH